MIEHVEGLKPELNDIFPVDMEIPQKRQVRVVLPGAVEESEGRIAKNSITESLLCFRGAAFLCFPGKVSSIEIRGRLREIRRITNSGILIQDQWPHAGVVIGVITEAGHGVVVTVRQTDRSAGLDSGDTADGPAPNHLLHKSILGPDVERQMNVVASAPDNA